jgi:hypothetical protein
MAEMAGVGEVYIDIKVDYRSIVTAYREIAKSYQAMAAQAAQMADHLESKMAKEEDSDG